jgi:hypothetical protein
MRIAAVFAVVLITCSSEILAQEPVPHMEMIRGLRAQGEPVLALQYIEERLGKKVPPEMAAVLRLETARTRLEIALQENEEGKRLAMFGQARAEFEAFLKNYPGHPLAPQANFEIARLIASQGKEFLNRARRSEGDKAAVKNDLAKARPLFEDATKKLAEAAALIDKKLAALDNPATADEKSAKRELEQSRLQAELEQGINLFQLAQTHEALKDRGIAMDRAQKVLQKLADRDIKHPMSILAKAWVGRCFHENEDYNKADDTYKAIIAESGPQSEPGKRVALYFRMLMLVRQGNTKPTTMVQLADTWLNTYRPYQNTAEGCGVKYLLASLLESLAEPGIIRDKKTGLPVRVGGDAQMHLRRAERFYKELADFENDFTERAAGKRMRTVLGLITNRAVNLDQLVTFDECYLAALAEIARLNETLRLGGPSDPAEGAEDVDKLKRRSYLRVIQALTRGLTLIRSTDSPKDILEARNVLVFAHLSVGNNHEAAILGESLSRDQMQSSKGASAALYALQAYANVMADTEKRGDVDPKEKETDKAQVRRIARYMEKIWPNDSPTDFARHQLATLEARENRLVDSLQILASITPAYSQLAYARRDQVVACYNLQRSPDVSAAEKKKWYSSVSTTLETMPDLAAGGDAGNAQAFCLAKIQLGYLYLLPLDPNLYPKSEAVARALLANLPKYTSLTEKARKDVELSAKALQLSGQYGQINELVKAGRNAEAAKRYEPIVAETEKELARLTEEEGEGAERLRRVIRDLLQLALRSSVQEGQIPRAQKILKSLEKAGTGQSGSNPLVPVLRDVQAQIAEVRKTRNEQRIKETTDRFAAFLEDLAKQPNITNEVRIFLAQGFSGVDRPARAVELLAAVTPAAAMKLADPGPLPENATDDQRAKVEAFEKEKARHSSDLNNHRFSQLAMVRALRADAVATEDAAQKEAKFNRAKQLLAQMIGTQQQRGWAYNNLEVRREEVFILEDQAQYAKAMGAWNSMLKPFLPKLVQKPANQQETFIRTTVFELRFYMIRCVYKSNLKVKDEKLKETRMAQLAQRIAEMEKDEQTRDFGGLAVKRLYQEFIEDDDLLKKKYVEAKGAELLKPADGGGN